MKYSILLILTNILTISCTNENNKYFKNIEGEWQIEKFYHKEKDLTLDNEKTYIETIRQKLKFYYPPGVKGDNPRRKANE